MNETQTETARPAQHGVPAVGRGVSGYISGGTWSVKDLDRAGPVGPRVCCRVNVRELEAFQFAGALEGPGVDGAQAAGGGQGRGEMIALAIFAAQDPQLVKLMNTFDAFGNNF